MLVIMHNTLCISHYAGFGKHSKLSNFWVTSYSLWVEPLVSIQSQSGTNRSTTLLLLHLHTTTTTVHSLVAGCNIVDNIYILCYYYACGVGLRKLIWDLNKYFEPNIQHVFLQFLQKC